MAASDDTSDFANRSGAASGAVLMKSTSRSVRLRAPRARTRTRTRVDATPKASGQRAAHPASVPSSLVISPCGEQHRQPVPKSNTSSYATARS
eukprot:2381350-Prymnesium_polylepis.1